MSILSPPVSGQVLGVRGLLRLMGQDVVIRYAEWRHTERDVIGPNDILYRIDLVAANQFEPGFCPDRYLWVVFTACQCTNNGTRGVYDVMKLDRCEYNIFDPLNTCATILESWGSRCPHWMRSWRFVGTTTLYAHEQVVESGILHPSDFWVQRLVASVLGMLFQAGKPAYQCGVADALGRWVRQANQVVVDSGTRP